MRPSSATKAAAHPSTSTPQGKTPAYSPKRPPPAIRLGAVSIVAAYRVTMAYINGW